MWLLGVVVALSPARFSTMLDRATFEDATIVRVGDARLARVLRGIRAAREDPKPLRAFELLYHDVAPIRFAGELVFRRIESIVLRKLKQGDCSLVGVPGDAADLLAARDLFRAVDAENSGCVPYGLLHDDLGEIAVDGHVDLDTFMRKAPALACWDDLLTEEPTKVSMKFDAMCDEFRTWSAKRRMYGDFQETSRLDVVLDGCFAGLENARLLAALRTVFEDYDSLRICADLIFKLMRTTAQRAPWYHVQQRPPANTNHNMTLVAFPY